jgi:hypothetical protein
VEQFAGGSAYADGVARRTSTAQRNAAAVPATTLDKLAMR